MVLAGATAVAAIAALALVPGQFAASADHLDPPSRTDPAIDSVPDIAADIADVFAFSDATNAYFVITFAGPSASAKSAFYDRDVLYTLNISTATPASSPEISIQSRFGPGTSAGQFGISVAGLPGVNGALVGPVEQILSKDGVRVYAGLRDDPFFFDLVGFRETRSTGAIRFDKNRDFFNGQNDTSLVFEIPKSRLGGATGKINVWATTARFGGQI
jgi:hypothetical protein